MSLHPIHETPADFVLRRDATAESPSASPRRGAGSRRSGRLALRIHKLAVAAALTFPVLFLLAALILVTIYFPMLQHDVALNITGAEMVLEGARPYVEVSDVNPPLIMYLSIIPVLVARVTGMSITFSMNASFIALVLYSIVGAGIFLRRPPMRLRYRELVIVASFVLLSSIFTYYQGEFGQRELLFFLIYLPLLSCRLVRHGGGDVSPWLAIIVGVMGFLGAGLKPMFCFTVFAVEMVLFALNRRWRPLFTPESWAFILTGMAYAAHFLLIPGMSVFYTRWYSIITNGYKSYENSFQLVYNRILWMPQCQAAFVAVVIAIWAARYLPMRCRTLLAASATATVASAFMVVYQSKGWLYHHITVWCYGLFVASILLVVLGRVLQEAQQRRAARTLPIIALFIPMAATYMLFPDLPRLISQRYEPWHFWNNLYGAMLRYTKPRDPVMILSTNVEAVFPHLTLADRRSASRYLWLFPVAFFQYGRSGYASPSDVSEEERRVYNELMEDFERTKPPLVLINTGHGSAGTPRYFSMDEYLRIRGFHRVALAEYREEPMVDIFRCFVRDPAKVGNRPMETENHTYDFGALYNLDDFVAYQGSWRLVPGRGVVTEGHSEGLVTCAEYRGDIRVSVEVTADDRRDIQIGLLTRIAHPRDCSDSSWFIVNGWDGDITGIYQMPETHSRLRYWITPHKRHRVVIERHGDDFKWTFDGETIWEGKDPRLGDRPFRVMLGCFGETKMFHRLEIEKSFEPANVTQRASEPITGTR